MDNIKISREARLDRRWAGVREKKEEIYRILLGISTEPKGIVSMFNCVGVLKEEIACHEHLFQNITEAEKNIYKSNSALSSFYKITKQAYCWKTINDKAKSQDERELAINECRRTMWVFLFINREAIDSLFETFKDPESSLEPCECSLLLKCVAVSLMEVDLKDMEIRILED